MGKAGSSFLSRNEVLGSYPEFLHVVITYPRQITIGMMIVFSVQVT